MPVEEARGGEFDSGFCPSGRVFDNLFFWKSNSLGVARGMIAVGFDSCIFRSSDHKKHALTQCFSTWHVLHHISQYFTVSALAICDKEHGTRMNRSALCIQIFLKKFGAQLNGKWQMLWHITIPWHHISYHNQYGGLNIT